MRISLSHSLLALGLAGVGLGVFNVGCSGADSADPGVDYTAQGACNPGDDEIDSDDGDAAARGPKRVVQCKRHSRDAGTTTSDGGTTVDAAPPPPPPPPTATTCTSFTYSAYGACQPDGTQTRTVTSSSPAGCTGGTPVLTQKCTYTPPTTTCTSFTYSAYGACQPNNTQTRTVLSSSPAGCTGGTPVTTQGCTYIDGAALYTQYCSGCHGNAKKGSSATNIQSAITKNTGGMGSLSFLTPAQIQAISAAP